MKLWMMGVLSLQGVANMEINRIKVCGFRNISEINLYFGNITALVGLNGYGKSNVSDAIDFGFDFIQAPNPAKDILMTSKHCIPILKSNAGQDFSFEIELTVESNKKKYYVEYNFSFSWKTNQSASKIKSESLRIKADEKNQKYNTYISRSETSAQYKPSETGRCSKNIAIDDNALVLNKLCALDDLFYLDIIKQLNGIQFFVERHLDASPSFQPDPFVIKGFQELELQGIQSIPRAIYFLKKDYPGKYELLINAFKQLFPEVIDLDVQEIKLNRDTRFSIAEDAPIMFTDSIYSIDIIDNKLVQPVGFEHLSDGTKRIFLMLTFAVIADIRNLSMIAIEEPENSIHPSLFQNYLDVLKQLVNNCKILVTSHSPYIIQYLDPSNIYIGMTSTTGEVDFRRIAPSKVNCLLRDAAEYDRSIGDYIFDLISSSDSDEYLKEYVESSG
ncbi:AAA family ATPase [Anaeromassilibacillus senegalensis]|uniref:AAA family ATPase n=1 Tax=Anaeromassilibacillus senegalensis TaxID=1673717 RepID=A0ABS9CNY3_9FIRM|nr:ATP-binding protein [Anaeromassilibacillus senegalensis]MCF2652852.1 AAA family ATPase [Anaeromassilibacillus senegalensis]